MSLAKETLENTKSTHDNSKRMYLPFLKLLPEPNKQHIGKIANTK